jgi:hypothetical protein
MTYQIIRNAIKTPDGTILESRHRHDYKAHIDRVTTERYAVDGGLDYFRGSINKVKPEYLHVTTEDHFEVQREAFTWGSYGKDGDEPKHYIKLKDMQTEHILAILDTQYHIWGTYVEKLFKQEIALRGNLISEYTRKTNNEQMAS